MDSFLLNISLPKEPHIKGSLPDVELGAVGDPGCRGRDGPEHSGQGEEGGHAHRHSSGHVVERDEEREPADDDEESGRKVRPEQVVGDLPHQDQLHRHPGVAA